MQFKNISAATTIATATINLQSVRVFILYLSIRRPRQNVASRRTVYHHNPTALVSPSDIIQAALGQFACVNFKTRRILAVLPILTNPECLLDKHDSFPE